MTTYSTIITNAGKALFANAALTNSKVAISHLAVGDGNGSPPTPKATATKLVKQTHKVAVNSVERHATRDNWIEVGAIIESSSGGYTVREIGLYAGATLVAIGSFPPTYKPTASEGGAREMSFRIIISVENASVVNVTLDDSLIYATRQWTEDNFVNHNEVINNLTSTDTNKPLSANMGKKLADEKANKDATLTAGNGLTGGGNLSANRTIALGTPSKITATSTNTATSTSHTHEIDKASTTTVGVVQLYDALDSDDATKALTAKQGKALREQMNNIDKIKVPLQGDLGSRDLNSINASNGVGLWRQPFNNQTTTERNYPTTVAGTLFVLPSPYEGVQLYLPYVGSIMYVRNTFSGGSWSEWRIIGETINQLDSTSITAALSANQGRLLNQNKLGKTENAVSASKLATARNIAMTGDGAWNVNFDGSGNATATMTLANSGVTAGSYNSVTVDAKGRVTKGLTQTHGLVTATTATGTANVATNNSNTFLNIVASGVGTTNSVGSSTQITGTNGITISSDNTGKVTVTRDNNSPTATKLATARQIALTGAVTGKVDFDGSANVSISTNFNLNEFANSKTENGYQKLPNGLIIQWGTYNEGKAISEHGRQLKFPIAFPNACLNAQATPLMAAHSAAGDMVIAVCSTMTATSALFSVQNVGSNSTAGVIGFTYIAIGY